MFLPFLKEIPLDTLLNDLFTLAVLIFLQAVLGFDNLLYISLESQRVAKESQQKVRRWGIGLAIVLRVVLLVVIVKAIDSFQVAFLDVHQEGLFEASINVHSLLVLGGGIFIIYTAVKEISHMLSIEHLEDGVESKERRSVGSAIAWIVAMNLVFSFDSILSAIALTKVFWIKAVAILVSGVLMIVMADRVADFLKKNRMYEVLGLFILLIVGVMLLSEGGHIAHLKFFGYAIEPMAKSTFYFSLAVLVLVDIAQSRYQKKLLAEKTREVKSPGTGSPPAVTKPS